MLFESKGSLVRPGFLFLITACLFASAQNSDTSGNTVATPPHSDNSVWQTYRDKTYAISIRVPSHWSYDPQQLRLKGESGALLIRADTSYEAEDVCESEARHKAVPYGSHPQIRKLKIAGQTACLVWPSEDQSLEFGKGGMACVVVPYPAPIKSQGYYWWQLVMCADKNYILEIAKTVKFIPGKRVPMKPPDTSAFMPAGVADGGTADLDFEDDGIPEVAFGYLTKDERSKGLQVANIKVLKFTEGSGWSVVFEDKVPAQQRGSLPYIHSVTSISGKEGLLVGTSRLGSRVFTSWYVLASINNKIFKLDPMQERIEALRTLGCQDLLSNFVVTKDDLLIDQFDGSTGKNLPTQWKPPILELSFRFTGSSLRFVSVKQTSSQAPCK